MTITIIILLCSLLLAAYLFDLTAERTKIPAVILLLALGFGLRQAALFSDFQVPDLSQLLPILGTLGLILIVLEGALELDLNKSKLPLVKKSFFGALASMLVLSFAMGYIVYVLAEVTFLQSLINVIPFSIISSSVAISSARNLQKNNKEFVIYESSLSDILGAIFFNFLVVNTVISFGSFLHFGLNVIVIFLISFIATMGLAFLLRSIDHPIKHAPIIILVFLIYAVSEIYHLPALIFILIFGLFLNNIDELRELRWVNKLKPYELKKEIAKFKDIVLEATFLIRSFFFIVFGFSIRMQEVLNLETSGLALLFFTLIVVVRWIILYLSKMPVIPLLFIAPRGLVTILLFLAIPSTQSIPFINESLTVQLIVLLVVFMMLGLMFTSNKKKPAKAGPTGSKKPPETGVETSSESS